MHVGWSRFTYQFPSLIKYLDFGTCKISPYCHNQNVKDKLVDKTNLVHSLLLVYLFLVYLKLSTCFCRICAHHWEKQLFYATLRKCYPAWMTVWYTGQNFTKCRIKRVFSPDDGHIVAGNIEIVKYTKHKLCTTLVLSTRSYRDARSPKHKKYKINLSHLCAPLPRGLSKKSFHIFSLFFFQLRTHTFPNPTYFNVYSF